jgi:hypothetical protein
MRASAFLSVSLLSSSEQFPLTGLQNAQNSTLRCKGGSVYHVSDCQHLGNGQADELACPCLRINT